jgi:hypothetical protein
MTPNRYSSLRLFMFTGAVLDSVPSFVPAADIRVQLPKIHRLHDINQRPVFTLHVCKILYEKLLVQKRRLNAVYFSSCVCILHVYAIVCFSARICVRIVKRTTRYRPVEM